MRYENAKNILPDELLFILQQYVQGTCLYIPSPHDHKLKTNREPSSLKTDQQQRNHTIFKEYQAGHSVNELAHRFYLSKQAIYKILKSFQ